MGDRLETIAKVFGCLGVLVAFSLFTYDMALRSKAKSHTTEVSYFTKEGKNYQVLSKEGKADTLVQDSTGVYKPISETKGE